jgi:hypothetical protein
MLYVSYNLTTCVAKGYLSGLPRQADVAARRTCLACTDDISHGLVLTLQAAPIE